MKKIETIWHHLLWQTLEKGEFKHTQKSLADCLGYSLSTVNLAIKRASNIGAVRVAGKFFVVTDVKKLLFYWATHRELAKDLIYKTFSDLSIDEIEGLIPPQAIMAGFSAARKILKEAPADYAKVFFYMSEGDLGVAKKRFPENNGKNNNNVFVLKSFPKQTDYGQLTTLPQTFVDIWGLSDWYARDFITGLEEKIDGLLS
jgi:hypothetical protein